MVVFERLLAQEKLRPKASHLLPGVHFGSQLHQATAKPLLKEFSSDLTFENASFMPTGRLTTFRDILSTTSTYRVLP